MGEEDLCAYRVQDAVKWGVAIGVEEIYVKWVVGAIVHSLPGRLA